MKNNQNNNFNYTDDVSIDIIATIKKIWKERKLIIKFTLAFFIIGCIVSIFSPVVYTSETTFVPQVSDDNSSTKGIGSLASLAGIKFSSVEETSDSYLSPLLYSEIIESEEFSLNLLNEQLINLNSEKLSVKEYLLFKNKSLNFNPIRFIKKYTIDLFFNNNTNEVSNDILRNYNFISDEDYSLIKSFRNKFSIELKEKQGYIKVLAMDEDAFICSQLVELITKSLQLKIIEVRTNKIKERLKFSKEQYEIKQVEFDILQKKLAEFKDSNKSISTASFMSKLQKLESDYQLQQSILINLAREYNNNKIKLNKDTPIFSVIDEVSVPNERSKPKRSLLVIIFLLVGLFFSIFFVLGKEPISKLINKLKD